MGDRKDLSTRLHGDIERILKESRQKSLTPQQILEALDLSQQNKEILLAELKKLQIEGNVVKTARGRYGMPENLGFLSGVLQGNRRGFAFLRPDNQDEDVFISAGNLNGAAHGDRVMVRVEENRGRRRREGVVIEVIKRGQSRLVGTLRREKKRFFVEPDDNRFSTSIQVSSKELKRAKPGDKVVVEIEKWSKGNRPSRGAVIEHFGRAGTAKAEQLTFKHRYELPGEFPPPVLQYVNDLPGEESIAQAADEQGRQNLRYLKMVTIDDETARDFDDAVSLELQPGGRFRLGVHIADVSHYVRQGKPIDREALKRGTSTYLVDKVIHMLPPKLSENLCSLQAGKDRLALSVLMDIDNQGELTGANFSKSVIKVTERLTYQQVETYFNKSSDQKLFQDRDISGMLDNMSALADILRERRMKRGALDLDLPEARIEVNEDGVPLSIEKRAMGRSESLIEEFMIYCNETVAEHLYAKKFPCIYRVHTLPTEEKLSMLRETLTVMGIGALSNIKVLKPKHLNGLLDKTRGEKTEKLVRYLVLRSLPQAQYSAENQGHFGLASECYCHFTSPIRRYPDLIVHRILKEKLSSEGLNKERIKKIEARLPEIARQSSERERAAVEAERASVEMKKAQFMEGKIGETYTGIINGVAGFGVFVELDNTVEGMIPVGELKDDYYIYNERAASLTGERTSKSYRLGDEIRVEVVRASREEGQVTFAPAGEN
ncbi:MAG: ribonuclease R [Bacillota bacterium]|nr:ribonuclease R [Bacillota bacterium]